MHQAASQAVHHTMKRNFTEEFIHVHSKVSSAKNVSAFVEQTARKVCQLISLQIYSTCTMYGGSPVVLPWLLKKWKKILLKNYRLEITMAFCAKSTKYESITPTLKEGNATDCIIYFNNQNISKLVTNGYTVL